VCSHSQGGNEGGPAIGVLKQCICCPWKSMAGIHKCFAEHTGIALKLWTCIWEEPSSNDGRDTGYLYRDSRNFPQYLETDAKLVP
jgi:hypothetical protein